MYKSLLSVPVLLLLTIAIPSLNTLYLRADDSLSTAQVVNVTGSQWKWRYTTNRFLNLIKIFEDQLPKKNRLYTNDVPLNVRALVINNKVLKLKITREDVIHSWFVPSAAIKVDAVPGKIREQTLIFKRSGIIFGNCAEVCGPFHRLIPIKLIVLL